MKTTNFAEYLSTFFTMYLPGQKDYSTNTIASYRDTFKLILIYAETVAGLHSERITLSDFNSDFVEGFLTWLKSERKNSKGTIVQRLAAIRSFVKYVKTKYPEYLLESQKVLGIKLKRNRTGHVPFLTTDAVKQILSKPRPENIFGIRDTVLLSLIYDSGARVQEICDLCVSNVRLQPPYTLTLHGKGDKVRNIPIMEGTAELLKQYIEINRFNEPGKSSYPLFFNHQKAKLTRAGVTYIIKKYWNIARQEHLNIPDKISPHVFRHTKAMHLLQANVNLVYIRDFLGHSQIATTEIYAKADTEMKRVAIENAQVVSTPKLPDWTNDKSLMSMLTNLC